MKNKISAMQRAAAVRLLCLDVDGTLTDGKLYIHNGKIGRVFSVLDGFGVQRFIATGGIVAIITAAKETEGGRDIRIRANQMGVRHVYTGVDDKLSLVRQLLRAESFTATECAFVGDDLADLSAVEFAGFAAAPVTAIAEVLDAVDYVATLPAGGGAVRDICDFILAARQTVQG